MGSTTCMPKQRLNFLTIYFNNNKGSRNLYTMLSTSLSNKVSLLAAQRVALSRMEQTKTETPAHAERNSSSPTSHPPSPTLCPPWTCLLFASVSCFHFDRLLYSRGLLLHDFDYFSYQLALLPCFSFSRWRGLGRQVSECWVLVKSGHCLGYGGEHFGCDGQSLGWAGQCFVLGQWQAQRWGHKDYHKVYCDQHVRPTSVEEQVIEGVSEGGLSSNWDGARGYARWPGGSSSLNVGFCHVYPSWNCNWM